MIVDEKKLQFSRFREVSFESSLNINSNSKALISRVDLSRVLSNLLNNAFESLIDYEGVIKLEVFSNQDRVHFKLTDTGVGIPEEILKVLSVGGVSTKKTGSGLGLSSSRRKILELGVPSKFNLILAVGLIFSLVCL